MYRGRQSGIYAVYKYFVRKFLNYSIVLALEVERTVGFRYTGGNRKRTIKAEERI